METTKDLIKEVVRELLAEDTFPRETLKEVVREFMAEDIVPRLDTIQGLLTKSPVGRTYTTKQAEELLGCNKATLWRWAKEGKLTPVKRGGQNLYRYEDIERFINND